MSLEDARLVKIGKRRYIFGLQSTPIATSMILIDPSNNKEVYRNSSNLNYTIGSVKGNVVRVIASNTATLMKVEDLVVGKKSVVRKSVLEVPERCRMNWYREMWNVSLFLHSILILLRVRLV